MTNQIYIQQRTFQLRRLLLFFLNNEFSFRTPFLPIFFSLLCTRLRSIVYYYYYHHHHHHQMYSYSHNHSILFVSFFFSAFIKYLGTIEELKQKPVDQIPPEESIIIPAPNKNVINPRKLGFFSLYSLYVHSFTWCMFFVVVFCVRD